MIENIKKIKRFLEKKIMPDKSSYGKSILNIPNPITFSRIIIAFILTYMFIIQSGLVSITIVFLIGMLTDALDGFTARKLKQVTEFGRQFDICADRFLLIVMVLGVIITIESYGLMRNWHLLQIFMIMSREIITFPFALMALGWGKVIPHVRNIGKLTTILQGITFPLIIFSVFSQAFDFSIFFSILTCISGIFSGLYYIRDLNLSKK